MKIIDRYITIEMFWTFISGVAVFTILFVAGGQLLVVAQMLSEDKTPLGLALWYLLNTLPTVLVFTFPMAVLLAALLSFGRISGESELVAMKAGGISFMRIATPAIMLSLGVAFISLYINNNLAPNSTYIAQSILFDQLTKNQDLISENIVIHDKTEDEEDMIIFARKLIPRENRMEDATIQYFQGRQLVREVRAKDAFFRPEDTKWYLEKAYINDYSKGPDPQNYVEAEEVYFPLKKSPLQIAKDRKRRPDEMNREQLKEKLDKLEQEGYLAGDEEKLKYYHENEVYYHQKVSIPFTCFVFGMFGIPLGIRPQRTSKAIGLGISIIFILVYYVLMSMGVAFGRNGVMPTFWAAWMPNMFFFLAGIILLYRVSRQ